MKRVTWGRTNYGAGVILAAVPPTARLILLKLVIALHVAHLLRLPLLWSFGQPPGEAWEPLLVLTTILISLGMLVLLERWWQRHD